MENIYIYKQTVNKLWNYTCSVTDHTGKRLYISNPGFHDKTTDVLNKFVLSIGGTPLTDWSFVGIHSLKARFLEAGLNVQVKSAKVKRQILFSIYINTGDEI